MFGKQRSRQPRTTEDRARDAAERASRRGVELPPEIFADATPPPPATAAARRHEPQPDHDGARPEPSADESATAAARRQEPPPQDGDGGRPEPSAAESSPAAVAPEPVDGRADFAPASTPPEPAATPSEPVPRAAAPEPVAATEEPPPSAPEPARGAARDEPPPRTSAPAPVARPDERPPPVPAPDPAPARDESPPPAAAPDPAPARDESPPPAPAPDPAPARDDSPPPAAAPEPVAERDQPPPRHAAAQAPESQAAATRDVAGDDSPEAAEPEPRSGIVAQETAEYEPLGDAEEWDVDDDAIAVEDPPEPPRRRRRSAAAGARRRPPPRRARQTASGSRGRWARRLVAIAALVIIGAALWLISAVFQPGHGEGNGAVRVTVPEGVSAGRVGAILANAGVVDNATWFQVNATLTGRRGRLRPGTYTLSKGMSNGQAIEALMQGPKARVVRTFSVTIPEGPSRREVAPLIKRTSVTGDYLKASGTRGVMRQVRRLGAPARARTPEGFLFPATYTLLAGATAQQLVQKQLAAFKANIAKVDLAAARRKHLTRYDVLIIASMVEREAQLDRERPLVAAVIYNRLKQGIPLGIDATIRYATNNWQRPIRVSELESDGPYNTRVNRGLPPTPIGNPGLASIKAAAKPARVRYLYYVRKPGNSGSHAFSSTDAQFQRDVAKYQASRTTG